MMKRGSLIEQALANRGGAAGRKPAPAPGNVRGNVPETPEPVEEGSQEFYELVEALQQLYARGQLPPDFDMEAACADPAFSDLLAELPPAAAIRVYLAEQQAAGAQQSAMEQVSAKMRSRGGLPKSQRSGAMASPAPDYAGMSSEAFRALLAQMKQTARNGGYTRL